MGERHAAGGVIDRIKNDCRPGLVSVAAFSLVANLLMLTGPLFMLQVYDRVLSSGSLATLAALCAVVVILYALFGFVDFIRARVMVRIARLVDEALRRPVFDIVRRHGLRRTPGVLTRPAGDLAAVRRFLMGPGAFVAFDLPWTAIYLAVIFVLHPVLGMASLVAVAALGAVALVNDAMTRKPAALARKAHAAAGELVAEMHKRVEAASALGMVDALRRRWLGQEALGCDAQTRANDAAGLINAISRTLRLMFQSGILAVGAWLAVIDAITPGAMIAASIIMARALAPVEQAVANWRGIIEFRNSWRRLSTILKSLPEQAERTLLPAPQGHLKVERLIAGIPGTNHMVLEGVSFEVRPGDGLGVIGPTGAGKSTLARSLVGVWPAMRGTIRLDGAELSQWDEAQLGRHIGYLPQEVELFSGTIAQNICRFDEAARDEDIIAAATAAGVHRMVLKFADGYNTVIGDGGVCLSAGQRQRLGLARALYGAPALLVLDEPNANLDADGEAALVAAIKTERRRGAAVIVVAHRPSAIAALDTLMVIKDGRVVAHGAKKDVLARVLAKPGRRHDDVKTHHAAEAAA